jgi:hypothetical protein
VDIGMFNKLLPEFLKRLKIFNCTNKLHTYSVQHNDKLFSAGRFSKLPLEPEFLNLKTQHIWRGKIEWNDSKCDKNVHFIGQVYDKTPIGVIAQEYGYHVLESICDKTEHPERTFRDIVFNWKSLCLEEKTVTLGGETSFKRDFADTIRLFILNPELLAKGRPKRFFFLINCLMLEYHCDLPWLNYQNNIPWDIKCFSDNWCYDIAVDMDYS